MDKMTYKGFTILVFDCSKNKQNSDCKQSCSYAVEKQNTHYLTSSDRMEWNK